MAVMPGAIYRPLPSKGRGRRSKGRGICLHVAVSEATSLFGFFSTSTSDSHFYVRTDGTIEQYIDTDLVAYANAAGNATLISVETQGGVTNPDGEPWTPQQIAALGRIVAWTAALDGYPIQAMPNSRAASRGVGYHRLGVNPWVVSGGEVWSSATGKRCPGDTKIAQIPQIIAAAKGGFASSTQENEMTPDETALLKAARGDANNAANIASEVRNWLLDPNVGVIKQLGTLAAKIDALQKDLDTQQATGGASVNAVEVGEAGAKAALRQLGEGLIAA